MQANTKEYNCPSCGAPLAVKHRFSKTVICEYCGQTSAITSGGLNAAGSKVELADFDSILSVGARGSLEGRSFSTLGRLRYNYEDGFWDEWFLVFDNDAGRPGAKAWLQEDEGEFTLFEKDTLTSPVPPFDEVSVGSMLSINNMSVFVTERNQAVIAGGEGELYFVVRPGMAMDCIDGNAGGKLVSIEYAPDEIHLSVGHEISLADIIISA